MPLEAQPRPPVQCRAACRQRRPCDGAGICAHRPATIVHVRPQDARQRVDGELGWLQRIPGIDDAGRKRAVRRGTNGMVLICNTPLLARALDRLGDLGQRLSLVKPGRVKASAAVRISALDQPRPIQWAMRRTMLLCQSTPARISRISSAAVLSVARIPGGGSALACAGSSAGS